MNANTPSIGTTTGVIDADDYHGKVRYIQNVGTNTLFVLLGTGASPTVHHFQVAGGVANDDGKGGLLRITQEEWAGPLSLDGTSPRYVFSELS